MISPIILQPPVQQRNTLVFDTSGTGHRANYVRTIAEVVDGDAVIDDQWWRIGDILRYPTVVFSTFETRPLLFAFLALLRSILWKRTVLLLLRATASHGVKGRIKATMHIVLAALPGVRLLTIMPITASPHLRERAYEIQDPEFWDRSEESGMVLATDLSAELIAEADGRSIILCTGMITGDKGMDFLSDVMKAPNWPVEKFLVCSVGEVMPGGKDAVAQIAALGGHVVNRYISDIELVSIFQHSRLAWCCYPPERDLSSGIFGRACQFGCWPLVRRQSVLDSLAKGYGVGTALPWGDADQAAQVLSQLEPTPFALQQNRTDNILRLKSVIFDSKPGFADPINRITHPKIEVPAACVE